MDVPEDDLFAYFERLQGPSVTSMASGIIRLRGPRMIQLPKICRNVLSCLS